MGSAFSKSTRKLPKRTETPSWTGARTPSEVHPIVRPVASEVKTEAVEQDSGDPHFLSKLQRLGPVKVDHHRQSISTTNASRSRFASQAQSEKETSAHSTRNRLLSTTLTDLLNERKAATSVQAIEALAERYDIDVAKLASLTRFVNSPSIDEGAIVKTVGQEGEEVMTTRAVWIEPSTSGART